jgi:hypothetical protein
MNACYHKADKLGVEIECYTESHDLELSDDKFVSAVVVTMVIAKKSEPKMR